MVKNKLEKRFSQSFKAQGFYGWKLHNNMLTHQTTPADYDICYVNHPWYKRYLVECKQCTVSDNNPKPTLKIDRLHQMNDMIAFQKYSPNHKSFFCIAWVEKRWTDSDIYLIPVDEMYYFVNNWHKQSINRDDMREHFDRFKTSIIAGNINLKVIL